MSKIHVLETNAGEARVVLHSAMPAGNNSVGVSWKDAALNSGQQGTTVLMEGTGAGQITTAELADVTAGDVLEVAGTIPVDSGGGTAASINEMADLIINSYKGTMQVVLKYFGYTAG